MRSTSNSLAGPDFIVAGVARSGTTSLFRYLQEHPEIVIPVKETFYFNAPHSVGRGTGQPLLPRDGKISEEDRYLAQFKKDDDQCITGEVATGYLYDHATAPQQILETIGDIPIIILLRNPVERAYSCYWHLVKNTREDLTFEQALAKEDARIEKGWDFMYHYKAVGQYSESIRKYQSTFSRVGVFFHDDLKTDPAKVMKSIYGFLGVDTGYVPRTEEVHNASGEVVNPGLQKLITRPNPIKKLFRPVLHAFFSKDRRQKIRESMKQRNMRAVPPLSTEMKHQLQDHFRKDVEQLEQLTSRNLKNWLAP